LVEVVVERKDLLEVWSRVFVVQDTLWNFVHEEVIHLLEVTKERVMREEDVVGLTCSTKVYH